MQLKTAFTISFFAGAGALLLAISLTEQVQWQLIAALIVLFYGLYVFKQHLHEKKAADSVYYLGFIFTLLSLLASFISLGSEPDQQKILNAFSVALSTTLVGLIIRTFIVQYVEVELASPEEVQTRLVEATNELVFSLSHINQSLNLTNKSVTKSFKDLTKNVHRMTGELVKRFEEMDTQSRERLDEANRAFQESLRSSSEDLKSSVSSLVSSVTSANDRMAQSADQHALLFETTNEKLDDIINSSESKIVALNRSLESTANSFSEMMTKAHEDIRISTSQVISNFDLANEKLSGMVTTHAELIGRSSGALDALVKGSDEGFRQVKLKLEEIGEASQAILNEAMSDSALSAKEHARQLALAIESSLGDLNDKISFSLGEVTRRITSNFKESLYSLRQQFIEEFSRISDGLPDFASTTSSLALSLERIDELAKNLKNAGDDAASNMKILADATEGLSEFRSSISSLAKDIGAFDGSGSALREIVHEMQRDLSQAQAANNKLTELLIENSNKVVSALRQ